MIGKEFQVLEQWSGKLGSKKIVLWNGTDSSGTVEERSEFDHRRSLWWDDFLTDSMANL